MTVKFLDIGKRRCAEDRTCSVNFYAQCCCAADAEVCEGRDPHVKCNCCSDGETLRRLKSQIPTVDLICRCDEYLHAVEVTERSDLWKSKSTLKEKIVNTKRVYESIGNVVFIISSKMKSDDDVLDYFSKEIAVEVRIKRPGENICTGER